MLFPRREAHQVKDINESLSYLVQLILKFFRLHNSGTRNSSGSSPSGFRVDDDVPSLLVVACRSRCRLRDSVERFRASNRAAKVKEDHKQEDHDQDEEDAQDHEVRAVADHHECAAAAGGSGLKRTILLRLSVTKRILC